MSAKKEDDDMEHGSESSSREFASMADEPSSSSSESASSLPPSEEELESAEYIVTTTAAGHAVGTSKNHASTQKEETFHEDDTEATRGASNSREKGDGSSSRSDGKKDTHPSRRADGDLGSNGGAEIQSLLGERDSHADHPHANHSAASEEGAKEQPRLIKPYTVTNAVEDAPPENILADEEQSEILDNQHGQRATGETHPIDASQQDASLSAASSPSAEEHVAADSTTEGLNSESDGMATKQANHELPHAKLNITDPAESPTNHTGGLEQGRAVPESSNDSKPRQSSGASQTDQSASHSSLKQTVNPKSATPPKISSQPDHKQSQNDTTSKETGQQQTPPIPPTTQNAYNYVDDDEEDDWPREKVLVDYASKLAGAQILEKSPSLKGTSNLLTGDIDRYAIAPCEDKKYVVIGLSEDILVKQIKLANYERYSSHVREFQILASQEYPAPSADWTDLGVYTAKSKSGEQAFELKEPAWARYLKFRFLGHYGKEHYCTVSQIKVHGSTMLQGFHEQWIENEKKEKEREMENEAKIEEDIVLHDGEESEDHKEERDGTEQSGNEESMKESVNETDHNSGSSEAQNGEDHRSLSPGHETPKELDPSRSESVSKGINTDAPVKKESYKNDLEQDTLTDKPPNEGDRNTSNSSLTAAIESDQNVNEAVTSETNHQKAASVGDAISRREHDVDKSSFGEDGKVINKTNSNPVQDDVNEIKESLDSDAHHSQSGSHLDDDLKGNNIPEHNDSEKSYQQHSDTVEDDRSSAYPPPVDGTNKEPEGMITSVTNESSIASMTDAVKAAVADATGAIKTVKEASSVQMTGAVNEIKKMLRTKISGTEGYDETEGITGNPNSSLSIVDHNDSALSGTVADSTAERRAKHKLQNHVVSEESSSSSIASAQTEEISPPNTHQNSVKSKPEDVTAKINDATAATSESSSLKDASILKENSKPTSNVKKDMGHAGASISEAITKISHRYPSASCIKELDFQAFKSKSFSSSTSSGGQVGGGAKMEPIFTKITHEIKSVQIAQNQYEQYVSAIKTCYERVFLDMVNDLDSLQTGFDQRLSFLESAMLEIKTNGQDKTTQDQHDFFLTLFPSDALSANFFISKIFEFPEIMSMCTGITIFVLLLGLRRKNKSKPMAPVAPPKSKEPKTISEKPETIPHINSPTTKSILNNIPESSNGVHFQEKESIGSSEDSVCSTPSAQSEPVLNRSTPSPVRARKRDSPLQRFRLKKK